MSDPNDRYYLARHFPQALSKPPAQTLAAQPKQTSHHPRPVVIKIVQQPAGQLPKAPTSHYITEKSKGTSPPSLSPLQLPNLLTLTLSVTVALLLLVAASMFSIALTAYSNSVDRVDNNRSFIHVE